ncbi:MAG: efflux RND transporter periplasmic adaptor subunit [Nitrospinota bacterium]|nr:efflux RND transporter periplasmic adaptor subunit [Nitrospinota bacterium]
MSNEKSSEFYRRRFIAILLASFILGGLYLARHPIERIFSGDRKMAEKSVAVNEERKIKYWVAPMDPSFRSDKPGKSPMGMDLVPVYEDDPSGGRGVRIDAAVEQSIGVKRAKVEIREISKAIKTAGRVTYDERKIVRVESKTKGWIEKLYVDSTGQTVKNHDYLLEIYSPELVATSEEFILALGYRDAIGKSQINNVVKGGEALLEASRRRLEFFDVPEHQINEMEKTRKVKKTLHIHSPVNGVVTDKNVVTGMHVAPGMVLYTIVDLSTVWVIAEIYEYEIPWVREGQNVSMELRSMPGKVFSGKVAYIYPYMEEKTRTVQVRMEFDNTDLDLKPEMYADVEILSDVRRKGVAVPKGAVIRSGSKSIVVLSKGSGFYEPLEVRLGVEGGDYYEVMEGLNEGDEVVTSANFLIDSESNLKSAVSGMLKTGKIDGNRGVNSGARMEMERQDDPKPDMDHSSMDHSKMPQPEMDHSKMEMDHGKH